MALSCIISEIKRDINLVENRHFFHTALHSTPPLGGGIAIPFCIKTRMLGLPDGKQEVKVI